MKTKFFLYLYDSSGRPYLFNINWTDEVERVESFAKRVIANWHKTHGIDIVRFEITDRHVPEMLLTEVQS